MNITFQGAKIKYSVVGEGETTVLLHGFLESSRIWREFLPLFSKYGKIITVDLPGHGRSDCIEEVHSMELMGEVLYEVLKTMRVKKANFVGHSMGGYVALAFLEAHPEMVGNIMLLNSTPAADTEEKKEIRDRSVELVRKNKAAYIKMAISNLLTPEAAGKHQAEVSELKEQAMKFPVKGITANLKGMKIRTDRTAILKQFSGGKIIISGKEDPILDYRDIKSLAQVTNSVFLSFSGGHLSYLENKEQLIKVCISSKI